MLETIGDNHREYIHSLPVDDRRRNGQVYTPRHLVDFVLRWAGYAEHADGDQTLLDPACGCGAFLESAVSVLADRIRATTSPRRFRSRLMRAVEGSLFGVDIDPQACAFARQTIRNAIESLTLGALPKSFFENNIICANFLDANDAAQLPPVRDYGGFHFIVGNPPYVAATRISATSKIELRKRFTTATGRLDLYALFIERSISFLAPTKGRLAFITPDKFLISRSGGALRQLIATTTRVRTIALFRSHKIFAEAATVPCVTILERSTAPRPVQVLRCAESLTGKCRIVVRERTRESSATLTAEPWHFLNRGELALVDRLRADYPKLKELTSRISAGIATGRDNIFVFPAGSQPDIEPELRHRVVRGRDIGAYGIDDPDLEILVPYTFDRSTGAPSLANLSAFPGARRYLAQQRAELETRHCVRVWLKSWYDLHDPLTFNLPSRTKILVPDVANSNRFAVDGGRFLPLHSAYYVLPKDGLDPHFLIGVLNSKVATYLIRLVAPVVKDGFSRYRTQFLAEIPVPSASTRARSAIAKAAQDGNAARVDDLVAALFDLSDRDSDFITSSLANMAQAR